MQGLIKASNGARTRGETPLASVAVETCQQLPGPSKMRTHGVAGYRYPNPRELSKFPESRGIGRTVRRYRRWRHTCN